MKRAPGVLGYITLTLIPPGSLSDIRRLASGTNLNSASVLRILQRHKRLRAALQDRQRPELPGRQCLFMADIVAKVENQTTPKISRKLIFRLPCRCHVL